MNGPLLSRYFRERDEILKQLYSYVVMHFNVLLSTFLTILNYVPIHDSSHRVNFPVEQSFN